MLSERAVFSKLFSMFSAKESDDSVREREEKAALDAARTAWRAEFNGRPYRSPNEKILLTLHSAGFTVSDICEHFDESARIIKGRLARYGAKGGFNENDTSVGETEDRGNAEVAMRIKEIERLLKNNFIDADERDFLREKLLGTVKNG